MVPDRYDRDEQEPGSIPTITGLRQELGANNHQPVVPKVDGRDAFRILSRSVRAWDLLSLVASCTGSG